MLSSFSEINYLAVLLGSIAYFALGALWYSQSVYGKDWLNLTKVKMGEGQSTAKVFSLTFLGIFITSTIMAYLVVSLNLTTFSEGVVIGLLTAVGFMGISLGITFMYESKPLKLFLIDAGYHFFGFLLLGTIITSWR